MRIVTVSSGAMTIHALISRAEASSYQGPAAALCACALAGSQKPSTNAPCAAAIVARNSRRSTLDAMTLLPHQPRGEVNGLPDAVVRAAAADVGDLGVDVGVGRVRACREQGKRAHDHPRLAVAALRCVEFLPGDLNGMAAVGREPFNRQDRAADGGRGGNAARTDCATAHVHRAGAALTDSAAELGARQPGLIPNHPQERRPWVGVDGMPRPVDDQIERHTCADCNPVRRALRALPAVSTAEFVDSASKDTTRRYTGNIGAPAALGGSMRSFKPLVVVALLSCAAAGVRAQQQFTLLARIVDPATNASPEKIDAGELRVLEDGVTGKVLRVEAVDRVVKVQVLVDNGAGVGSESIADLRKGLRGLIETLPPGVETSIYTTAPQARPLVRPTSDRAALLKGVDLLTPDRTTGLFTESLGEAAQRAIKEKEDVFTIIICAATVAGDNNVQDRDIQRAFDRIQSRPMIVHVLLYSGGPARASGGIVQTQVGLAVAKATGGRYENINTMSRYVSLMPELGAEVAKQMAGQTRQFRILAQRPDGKTGNLGGVSLGVTGQQATGLTLERTNTK